MKLLIKKSLAAKMQRQKGVVLFLALIALVAMSLAAVALIRSVDTSTLIAGNLASKHSATASADSGMEAALTWISALTNLATLNSNSAANAANGYYATQALDPSTLSWNATDSASASDGSAGTSGNTVRYIIQRMCRAEGEASEENCLLGAPALGTSSSAVKDATKAGAILPTDQTPIYRITARVVGVKNTISFVQAFAY